MNRRIATGIAAVMAGLGLCAWAGSYVVGEEVLRRLGCVGTFGYSAISPRAIRLHSVNLICRRGEVHVDSLELRGGVTEIARGRVESVIAHGGSVSATLQEEAPSAGSGALRGALPAWTAEDLQIEIRDTARTLARTHLVRGHGSATGIAVDLDVLVTSDELSPSVTARQIHASFIHNEHWQVAALSVDGLQLAVTDEPSLRDAFPRRTVAMTATGASSSILDRFTANADVSIRDAQIVDSEGVSVSALTVRATRAGLDSVRLAGEGSPRGAGHLRWDVTVQPSSMDADGHLSLERVPWSILAPFAPDLPLQRTESTLLSGSLELHAADHRVNFSGTLSVASMTLVHPRLAADPVLVDGSATGAGYFDRTAHELVIDRATITVGRAHVNVAGRILRHGEQYGANLDVSLPSTSCQAAVSSIPHGLLQETDAWTLEGAISASGHLEVDSEHLDDTVLGIRVNDGCRFVGVPAMADINRFRGPFRHIVAEPDTSVFEMETGPGTAEWTSIYEISPFLVHSVVAHEDAAFFRHSGFAPWAIRDALVRNLRERRYVLGASTITMQLVKNVFLHREKTLARKVQEVLLTWWLERSMSKQQILELYLNVIEYGPQVYGVRHAASHYFGRTPAELTPAEAAYLSMILPNPPSFHEHFESGAVPPPFARRVRRFVDTLRERGRIDDVAHALAVQELTDMRFSRDGERVGPELRGGSASLPIEGFSGMPLVEWSDGSADGDSVDESLPSETWDESWP